MHRLVILISTALLASLAVISAAEEPQRGGTLIIGHDSLRHLNAAIQSGNSTGIPATQIFAGLIQLDDQFQAQPYLAKSWDVSDDGLRYTFHLVDNASFHDGQPVTSEDVAFPLDIVKNNHPFGVAMFAAIEQVETPDSQTVVIQLNAPHPALLAALSPVLMPVLPKHVYGTEPIREHPANAAPIGAGPFKFVEWQRGEHIVLERNENFFRPGRPYLDRIVFKIIKDTVTRRLALEQGEVDYMPFSNIRVRDIPKLQESPQIEVTTDGYEALGPTNYLEFNHRKPPLDDLRVRKAIAHAIDRDFITQKLHLGVSVPLHGPLHSSSPYASDDLVMYEYDLDKANQLLDAASHPRGADGFRFKLTLDLPTFHPDSSGTVGEYLKPQLKKSGGAGPVFAAFMARDLGMAEVLVPPRPGVFSATGLLLTDIRHNLQTPYPKALAAIVPEQLSAQLRQLQDTLNVALERDGIAVTERYFQFAGDLRCIGQFHELPITLPQPQGVNWWQPEKITADFHHAHEQAYGHADPNAPVEIVNLRVEGYGRIPKTTLPVLGEEVATTASPTGYRQVCLGRESGFADCAVYRRTELRPGHDIAGPALIVQRDSTVLVLPGQQGRVSRHGVIRISENGALSDA